MKIIADINKVSVDEWYMLSGEYNNRTIEVQLSDEMLSCEGCLITFKLSNGTVIEYPVNDGRIELPCFIEPQQIIVGAYTYDTDENGNLKKRYSPEACKAWIRQGSFDGVRIPVLSPGSYAELLKQIAGANEAVAELSDEIETIKTEIEQNGGSVSIDGSGVVTLSSSTIDDNGIVSL